MKSFTALIVAAIAGTTLAAPSERRQNPPTTLYPIITSQYNVKTGAVAYNTNHGVIDKSTSNNGADTTTLVTFYIDQSYNGLTCQFVFDSGENISGSARADAYSAIAPATVNTQSWPQGNLRDQQLGRLVAQSGQPATWEQSYPKRIFPCADAAGKYYASELVGVWDNDHIEWTPNVSGPKILAY